METIDIRGLPEQEVELLQDFVKFLKVRVKRNRRKGEKTRKALFTAHQSDVIGGLKRKEIYEDV